MYYVTNYQVKFHIIQEGKGILECYTGGTQSLIITLSYSLAKNFGYF